jgi:toxin FitB
MSYLLDTNVVSELRKSEADENVRRWVAGIPESLLYVSVLALGEIRQGIERLRPRDPRQADVYEVWLRSLEQDFAARILPVDHLVAAEWGRLNAVRALPVIDGLMAATAKVKGWTLVTRNGADVADLGLPVLDPWTG